jgi:hypothetical protein
LIHSRKGRLRAVSLSAAVLGGSLGSLGFLPSSAVASTTATKTSTFTLVCNAGILGNISLTGSKATATYPASAKHGSKFSSTFNANLQIPASVEAKAAALGSKQFDGTVTLVNVSSSDASPSPLNVASPAIPIPKTPVIKNKAGHLLIPHTGNITMHFTAGSKTGTDTAKLGNAAATIHEYNSAGVAFLTISVTCQPPAPTVTLVSTKIT